MTKKKLKSSSEQVKNKVFREEPWITHILLRN